MDELLEKIYALSKREFNLYSKHVMLGGGTKGGSVIAKGKGIRLGRLWLPPPAEIMA